MIKPLSPGPKLSKYGILYNLLRIVKKFSGYAAGTSGQEPPNAVPEIPTPTLFLSVTSCVDDKCYLW
jgi:hypothetical protein